MRIVSWNCQGAFRKKATKIASYRPDIAIIQECEYEDSLYKEANFPRPTSIKCFGELKYKGISIMSYTGLEFELDESYNPEIQYCIPIRVKGETSFNLIAVWTQAHEIKNESYIGQAYKAINYYKKFISSAETLLIGDFNSNQIWDKERTVGNHSDVVSRLKEMGIVSLYHELNNEKHGSESQYSFFMNRKHEKSFHIDYCFAPESWVCRVKEFKIDDYGKWSDKSDHSPIFVEFDMESLGDEGSAEVYSVVNGKKTDAFIHEAWMEDVEESEEYRMTSYNSAINCGISKKDAALTYLKPGDKSYDIEMARV
jgi:exodeoxyribonuclease III